MEQSDNFASSSITLSDGRELTKCDQCRQMHAERVPPTVPPCDTCWVDLNGENQEAATIYQLCRGQIRTRHNGQYDEVVDLDYSAVKMVMDLYGVRDQRSVFEKVRRTFFHFVSKSREK
jgi:hypothetical protein